MKLQIRAAAIAGGLLWGLMMLGVGLLNWSCGYGQGFLQLMADIYPGYNGVHGMVDLLTGTAYGLLDGAIAAALFAWVYNLAVREK